MSDPVLQCQNVSKRYGKHTVLDNIELVLQEGEIFGLLGPNGAGKTTFIKILLGLCMPNAGTVQIFGKDLFTSRKAIMRDVGAIVEAPAFFDYLSAFDNLRGLVSLNSQAPCGFTDKIHAALASVGLRDVARDRVGTFSYGMKQRLGIAQSLLPESKFLILDEPTNGLDPHGIVGMRNLIRKLARERQITVLVSSHMLNEIEQICDRVMIIHQGLKILEKPVRELQRETGHVDIRIAKDEAVLAGLRDLPVYDQKDDPEGESTTLSFHASESQTSALVRELVRAGAGIQQVESRIHTLEEIFLAQTGSESSDVRNDTF